MGSPSFTQPTTPIPIIATLKWEHGVTTQVEALAIGWTREKVKIQWKIDWVTRIEWIPATDVQRRPTEPDVQQ